MKKDVIYIDIEDDITSIIGKVKASEAKIVALVPPKRSGVLQSVVNLKLLQKSTADVSKQLVLITNDHNLLSLASGVKIPVARNLQSRPELAPIPALQIDDEDIIDGSTLPVGELDQALGPKEPTETSIADEISQRVELQDNNQIEELDADISEPTKTAKKTGPKKVKVPDFMSFRKWLFLGAGGIILLSGFLYWAFKIAPHATVIIAAKTSSVPIDRTIAMDATLSASDIGQLQIKSYIQQVKKSVSTEFDATGTKDTGNKATGTVTATYSYDSKGVTIPAGTVFTAASGQKFVSSSMVVVPGATVSGGGVQPGTATVPIQASDIGPEYNVPAQGYTVSGIANVSATGMATTGGSRDKITIVTQDDINKAKTSLALPDSNSVKNDLRKQFASDMQIIDESFTVDPADPTPTPNAGEQAKRAKLTQEATYTLQAVSKNDLKKVLADALKDALNSKPNQSIFSDGADNVQFKLFQKQDGNKTASITLDTTGFIGTSINIADFTKQIEGKRFGEITQIANQIPGVNKVDITLSPFWVNQAPDDPKKIDVKFSVSQ